jgi:hypothetical protein
MELSCELDLEHSLSEYKYIYCVIEDRFKQYYLYEEDTRYIHNKGGEVRVIRCREGDLVYVRAKMNSKDRF